MFPRALLVAGTVDGEMPVQGGHLPVNLLPLPRDSQVWSVEVEVCVWGGAGEEAVARVRKANPFF